jgi:DNA topoisomerase-1
MSSSSEEEFEDVPLSQLKTKKTKTKTNGGTRNAKPDTIPSKSNDDDDDFEPEPKSKPKKKANAAKKTARTASNKRKVKERDADEDEDDAFVKKKKVKNGTKVKVKKETKVKREPGRTAQAAAPKKLKKLERADRIAHAMQSFLWWDAPSPPEGCQWSTMEHAGVSFTEPYEPHGVKMRYDGEEVDLSPVEEEA